MSAALPSETDRDFIRTEFMGGFCSEFAIALHDALGYGLAMEVDSEGSLHHAWALNRARRAVDVRGVHVSWIARSADVRQTGLTSRFAVTNRAELLAFGFNLDAYNWAMQLITNYPAMLRQRASA